MTRFALVAGGLVAGLLSVGSVQAQDALSPEAKQMVAQACRSDFASLCANAGQGSMKTCIRENFRSFSQPCQGALKQAMAQRQQ